MAEPNVNTSEGPQREDRKRLGEQNRRVPTLGGGSRSTAERPFVYVNRDALEAIRQGYGELVHYVLASFEVQGRRADSLQVTGWLVDVDPERPYSSGYWRSFVNTLEAIQPLRDALQFLPELTEDANAFDSALREAIELARRMTRPTQSGDASTVASDLQDKAFAMNDACKDILLQCEHHAKEQSERIAKSLHELFTEINLELDRHERQVEGPALAREPAAWGKERHVDDGRQGEAPGVQVLRDPEVADLFHAEPQKEGSVPVGDDR